MSKIYVDEIRPKTSGGVVRFPDKPAWRTNAKFKSVTSTGDINAEWNNVTDSDTTDNRRFFLNGCVLQESTKVYIPATGFYQINVNMRVDGVGSGYVSAKIEVNGAASAASLAIVDDPSASYENLILGDLMYLREGDLVTVELHSSSDSAWEIEDNSTFSGILIG